MDTMDSGPLDALNAKILRHLGDRVILKPLTQWNEAYKEFPRYVMEYLVSRYVQSTNPVAGQTKIDRILTEHYAESAKKELIKSRIKERGDYTLLGQFSLRLDQARDHYWADVPALGDNTVRVAPKVREQYGDILLTSGAWGTMEIEYDATYEIKDHYYRFGDDHINRVIRDMLTIPSTHLVIISWDDPRTRRETGNCGPHRTLLPRGWTRRPDLNFARQALR